MTLPLSLCDLLCPAAPRLVPHLGPVTEQAGRAVPTPQYRGRKNGAPMASFSMSDSQQVSCTITATDRKGNPASLPAGSVQWSVDLPTLLALTPSADGQSCLLASVGPLGTATVTCKVVDGAGATLAAGTLGVTVTGGAAAAIVITPGTPAEQP